jgi:4-alpha-glucanotransferase
VDWSDRLRDAILELAYGAGSARLFVPIQDLFGWRDRINMPGTVASQNWTWCLPWPVDRIEQSEIARERAGFLHQLARMTSRLSGLH